MTSYEAYKLGRRQIMYYHEVLEELIPTSAEFFFAAEFNEDTEET